MSKAPVIKGGSSQDEEKVTLTINNEANLTFTFSFSESVSLEGEDIPKKSHKIQYRTKANFMVPKKIAVGTIWSGNIFSSLDRDKVSTILDYSSGGATLATNVLAFTVLDNVTLRLYR